MLWDYSGLLVVVLGTEPRALGMVCSQHSTTELSHYSYAL